MNLVTFNNFFMVSVLFSLVIFRKSNLVSFLSPFSSFFRRHSYLYANLENITCNLAIFVIILRKVSNLERKLKFSNFCGKFGSFSHYFTYL